jgi:potassium/chloride transporter 9
MLLLVRNPRTACSLIHFVNHMKKGGLYVLGHVQLGDYTSEVADPSGSQLGQWMGLVDRMRIKAFVELTMTQSVRAGVHQLIRLSGLGGMKPNTIILGFPERERGEGEGEEGDDLTRATSPYYWPGLEKGSLCPDSPDRLDPTEFVYIIADTLKMEKNVIICRNFKTINLSQLRKNKSTRNLDIWPINFLYTR